MRPSMLVSIALCAVLASCSKPRPPETERRPVPQATQLRDAVRAPQDKARATQDAVDDAARQRDAAIDDAGG